MSPHPRFSMISLAIALTWVVGTGVSCNSGSGTRDPAPAAGTTATALPDSRVFAISGSGAEVQVLDGNASVPGLTASPVDVSSATSDVALDARGNRLWWVDTAMDKVLILDANELTPIASRSTGADPGRMVVVPETGYAFVIQPTADQVRVFQARPPYDEVTESPLASGVAPDRIVSNGSSILVLNATDETVSVFSATPPFSEQTGSPFPVGLGASDLAVDADLAFVTNEGAGTISVLDLTNATTSVAAVTLSSPFRIHRHTIRDQLFVLTRTGLVHVLTSDSSPTEAAESPAGGASSDWTASSSGSLGAPASIGVSSFRDRVWIGYASGILRFQAASPYSQESLGEGIPASSLTVIEPKVLATLAPASGGAAERLRVEDGEIRVAFGSSGLIALNEANGYATFDDRFVYRVPTPSTCLDVVSRGRYTFISTGNDGVQVVDEQHSLGPRIVQTVDGLGTADELFLLQGDLIVETGSVGFSLVDIRFPTQSRFDLSFDLPGSGVGFDLRADRRYAFSADSTAVLRVVDLFTPTVPIVVEEVGIPVAAEDVAVITGERVVVAAGVAGVVFVRVAPLVGSSVVGQLIVPDATITRVFADEDLVYAIANDGRLLVIDAKDIESPRLIGTIVPATTPSAVVRSGRTLYTCEGAQGLRAYRF